jgi:hypothetical protein
LPQAASSYFRRKFGDAVKEISGLKLPIILFQRVFWNIKIAATITMTNSVILILNPEWSFGERHIDAR